MRTLKERVEVEVKNQDLEFKKAVDELRKVRFTSQRHFLIGENVRLLSNTKSSINGLTSSYSSDERLYKVNPFNMNRVHLDEDNTDSFVHLGINNGGFNVGVEDIDLAIDDDIVYYRVKTERLNLAKFLENEKERIEKEKIEKTYKKYKKVIDIFDENVDKDKWDFSENNDGRLLIYLHYPEVHISNSIGLTHTIKDLYFRLSFHSNGRLYDMTGCRGSVSVSELAATYWHSHIGHSSAFYNLQSCCVGSSEFAQLMSLIRNEFNINNLTRFIYQLNHYVEWESLEGGPYIKMENVLQRMGTRSSSFPGVPEVTLKRIYKNLIEDNDSLNFLMQSSIRGEVQLNLNEDLNTKLLKYSKNYICKKVGETYYLPSQSINTESEAIRQTELLRNNRLSFKFKGKNPKLTVYPDIQQEITGPDVPWKQIKDYVVTRLNNEINKCVSKYE